VDDHVFDPELHRISRMQINLLKLIQFNLLPYITLSDKSKMD